MGNRIRTRLIAVCLVATAIAVSSGYDPCAIEAAESSPRLVRIDMAALPPLPRLVPITQLPISQTPSVAATPTPRPLSGPASPPLVSISYAPAPAAIKSLAIQEVPAPIAAPVFPSMPVAIPAPAYVPPPVTAYTPPAYTTPAAAVPPVYQSAALPPPLPVSLAPPLPVSLPPPLPVYATPSVPAYAPLPVYAPPPVTAYAAPVPAPAALPLPLPVPLPVPAASTALAPPPALPPMPTLPQQAALPPPLPTAQASAPAAAPASGPAGGKPTDAITICSFNIQVFGESKISKPQVVDVLTKVVRKFDIVAIQEVRAKSDSVIPQFLSAINADGSRYQFVIGPRLGRTVSKEQYTFIYDSTRIEVDPSSVGTSPNPGDRLHRPPLHARFRVRANPPESGFSFWLVDTHTDPDEVSAEVNALADVFTEMKALRPDEDDVILMGDFNAGPPQFGKIKQIPGVGWAVSGVTTNTRRSKTYDNLIFDTRTTTEYTGRWGVLDLQNTFGLSLDKALEVSDHNPVWAAFRPLETRQVAGAAMPAGLTR
ncbi:MAG: endonuclease/exonuclease/phosphatase family protein [Planctomycetia bacterium]|nr:endonuclease/exonuclease/phosphatase family protein [Planctomycetia bacterium]